MSGPEFRTIRQGLGITAEWLGERLDVNPRTVERWDVTGPPKAFASDALRDLMAEADAQVAAHLAAFAAHPDSPLIVLDEGAEWPLGWQRAIAFRVLLEAPELHIIVV